MADKKDKPTEKELQDILDSDDTNREIVTTSEGGIRVVEKPIYQWILFQIKGGGKIVGLVDVGTEDCKRDHAAAKSLTKKGELIEVGNVHQVMVEMSPGRMAISAIPMDYGDRRIFLRTEEITFSQFMGEGSSLIAQIAGQQSKIIKAPAPGLVVKP